MAERQKHPVYCTSCRWEGLRCEWTNKSCPKCSGRVVIQRHKDGKLVPTTTRAQWKQKPHMP